MSELQKLLDKSYLEIVNYLLKKYGTVLGDFFTDKECLNENFEIKKASTHGLFIHHIDEDKALKLSDPKFAIQHPFKYQKADRLVYCNYLEHLLLHIKIFLETKGKYSYNGTFEYLIPKINDIYSGEYYSDETPKEEKWPQTTAEQILDKKEDYLMMLEQTMKWLIEDETILEDSLKVKDIDDEREIINMFRYCFLKSYTFVFNEDITLRNKINPKNKDINSKIENIIQKTVSNYF